MNWNLVGSIYGRSFIKIAHFVTIHQQTWPPQAILAWPKWAEIWREAPMEGSVLCFLKAEWKVSDTGSAQCWASSSLYSLLRAGVTWEVSDILPSHCKHHKINFDQSAMSIFNTVVTKISVYHVKNTWPCIVKLFIVLQTHLFSFFGKISIKLNQIWNGAANTTKLGI